MTALYRQASVVLNTSRFEGGMANSLLEAMACSRPVLAADIEGNRSLVNDGVTGLLYRDTPEFLDKAKLLLDLALRQRLGNAGRRLVEERHSPGREAAAYLGLYEEILAAERTSADF
jgi:glycosyltransferase involved in cell wall biosynthesis